MTGKRSKRDWWILLIGTIIYWAALPAALLYTATRIDSIFAFFPLPTIVAVPIGGVIIAASLILSGWCVAAFYLRGDGFPIAFLPPMRLVREGPYALSRHPLYLAFSAYLLGLSLIVRSLSGVMIVVPAVILLWILYAAAYEERVLLRRYSDEYRKYMLDVPFFFQYRRNIPGPSIVYATVYLVGKAIVHLLYSVDIEGEENLPSSGPFILLANHASYLDPVFVVAACNCYLRYFTTGEMMRTRLGRWFFNGMGSIPTSRYRVDSGSVRAFLSTLRAKEIVGIFPEGERTWDGNPIPINPTVVRLLKRSNVPLVAARIDGSYAAYPRWSSYLLPGRVKVQFFSPSSSDEIEDVLSHIRSVDIGRTLVSRSTRGVERLIWACPGCGTIGGITAHDHKIICERCHAEWTLDRSLNLTSRDGKGVPLQEFVSFLKDADLFQGMDTLSSIGPIDLLVGGENLTHVASGEVAYRDGALHVDGREFPLTDARIIRLEGKDRLDIGLAQDRRLRMVFHRDSTLKWERFLRLKLEIEP